MENLPLQDHVGNLEFFWLRILWKHLKSPFHSCVCTLIGQRDEEEQIWFAIVK